jgi:hypothetical protein
MPKRRKNIRRRSKPVEDYDEIEDLEEDQGEEIEEFEEEEVEEEPAPKRRSKRRAPRVVDEDDVDDEGYGDDEDAPSPEPKLAKKSAKKPSPVPDVIEVKKVDDQVAEGVFSELLEAMRDGQAIIAVRLPGNKWQFVTGDIPVADTGPKLKGKEYYDEVQTENYKEFVAEWGNLTYQEKVKKAKKLKVKWEAHEDKRVDNIRLMLAVREKLGIEKYKPDYINKSARDRLRGK